MNLIKKLSNHITLPKLKKCPYCFSINILGNKWAEISCDNPYPSLENWTFKKKFNCRGCKIELGLFIHKKTFREAIIWLDFFAYSGVTKPFLKQKNYKFLKDTRKKNWFKTIFKTFSGLLIICFSLWAFGG